MKNVKDTIREWLESQDFRNRLEKDGFDSRHIDDLFDEIPDSPEGQIRLATELYREVLEMYADLSGEMMATLVVGLGEADHHTKVALDDVLAGKISLWPSPEIYMTRREMNTEPYVVEEYKAPVSQGAIIPSKGVVYAYYRSMRNSPEDKWSQGIYFEHYPEGSVDHPWS